MSELGSDERGGRLTYADYAAFPDDGHRYQLVEGELVMTPAPSLWHQLVLAELVNRLKNHVDERHLGVVLFAPADVVLDDHNVLQPDILFVSDARRGILTRPNVQGAPDLCVEVLSPGTERLDRLRKMDLYARHGVAHCWIVDPAARVIEEYVLAGDVFRVRGVTAADAAFQPLLFPGFAFRLGDVELPGQG